AVIVNLNRAAAGLLQVIQLEALGFGEQENGLARDGGGHADTAQAIDAVAGPAHQAVTMPATRGAAFHVEAAVGIPGASGEGIATAAVAKSLLQVFADIAGPF